jgi:hypothetical protein
MRRDVGAKIAARKRGKDRQHQNALWEQRKRFEDEEARREQQDPQAGQNEEG